MASSTETGGNETGGKKKQIIHSTPEPDDAVKQLRTLSLCAPLRRYLQSGAGNKVNRHIDYTKIEGHVVWVKINEWLCTPDGIAWCRRCEVDPQGRHLDHAIPQKLGGASHLQNAHLMPAGMNTYFQDRFDTEKRAYIGRDQVNRSIHIQQAVWKVADVAAIEKYSD
jgi:hypothetical protein